jgi:glutathione peroxidase-family protein
MSSATSFYDLKPLDKKGETFDFDQLKGKVVLVVNVASKCGFTPQYKGLEELYKKYHGEGLEILGFPCNQFGGQEPGSQEEIESFCQTNYGVSFPIMKKINVNGEKADPVYNFLKEKKGGLLGFKGIKWNFEKFLIDRDGNVTHRWASTTNPEKLAPEIEKLLKQSSKEQSSQ